MEQNAISSDLIRGHIDTIILHTLLDGDKFAQQISDAIEQKSDGEYKINQATLYSSLKRLENLKHVSSYWYDTAGGRRKYFKLTTTGKETVENNLSSWSFSRAIIDKLMDCTPQVIYKTQYVEKVVEVDKKEFTTIASTPIPTVVNQASNTEIKVVSENKPTIEEKIVKTNEINTVEPENKQEINFRNILNGLIKTTEIVKEEPQTELEPLEKVDTKSTSTEKLKFNETLISTDYNAQKANNNGKIDFGDITLKAAKEGYKVRISSKDSAINEGTFLINKLNLISSIILLSLCLFEFLIISLKFKDFFRLDVATIVIVILFLTIYPAFCLFNYLKKPKKTISKRVSADVVLTVAIIVFNLLLITVSANLLCNVNFENMQIILYSLIIPIMLCIDTFVYYLIKFSISKFNTFILRKK